MAWPLTAQRHVSCRLYCLRELNAMTLTDWQAIPITRVPVADLIPTQACLVIDRLIDLTQGGPREHGDLHGHVIDYCGQLYIHDGHHDWALAWLRGRSHVPVRVKHIDTACCDPCCDD